MNIRFDRLSEPTPEIASAFTKWENDPALVYLARPNNSQADIDRKTIVTPEELYQRLKHNQLYLIYMDDLLVGEMSFSVDPSHLFKKESPTAWIGITIGEETGRGKGIGAFAMLFLEEQIKAQAIPRIELGVFEFNAPARRLYEKLGYQDIGRISDFTFWQDKMWNDIRMEKYVLNESIVPSR